MLQIGKVEKVIYELREEHPLVIPQLDPDKNTVEQGNKWFRQVKDIGIKLIAVGGSTIDAVNTQRLLDMAVNDYNFLVLLYLTANINAIKGKAGRTAAYWMQVPNALNTLYNWDGLISNSMQMEKNELEALPTVYVFDDRGSVGTANWITRSNPIPKDKPELSLAVAKAAQFLGIRFYVMAGGSGSASPPPTSHIERLAEHTQLFVIPTSGINTVANAKALFAAGADAIHVGNRLEQDGGFKELDGMYAAAKEYPGRKFL
jgi:phosphoglycerol geranylgeranyltransferase